MAAERAAPVGPVALDMLSRPPYTRRVAFATVSEAQAALERHQDAVLALPGVTGVGIGIRGHGDGGQFVIHVLVESGRDLDRLRQAADGVMGRDSYDIVGVGEISAQHNTNG